MNLAEKLEGFLSKDVPAKLAKLAVLNGSRRATGSHAYPQIKKLANLI